MKTTRHLFNPSIEEIKVPLDFILVCLIFSNLTVQVLLSVSQQVLFLIF